VTREQAKQVAQAILNELTLDQRRRFKAVDILPRLHSGMLTIRLYFINKAAEEPESYQFPREELWAERRQRE
jgi:hypothetical protein